MLRGIACLDGAPELARVSWKAKREAEKSCSMPVGENFHQPFPLAHGIGPGCKNLPRMIRRTFPAPA